MGKTRYRNTIRIGFLIEDGVPTRNIYVKSWTRSELRKYGLRDCKKVRHLILCKDKKGKPVAVLPLY